MEKIKDIQRMSVNTNLAIYKVNLCWMEGGEKFERFLKIEKKLLIAF